MNVRIGLILVLILTYSTHAQATVTTYDAVADFSASNNPNGVWSYGYCDPGIGITSFATFTYPSDWSGRSESLPTVKTWQQGTGIWDPSIDYNDSDKSASGYGYTWAAHALTLDSYGGLSPIIRWQAPQAGTVDISATFTDMGPTSSMAFFIDGAGTVLMAATTTSTGVTYSNLSNPANAKNVNAGDYVYFATSGSAGYGSVTQFSATITLTTVPEPSAMALGVLGLVGFLAYGWRKRN
jgi:hypothetical protein